MDGIYLEKHRTIKCIIVLNSAYVVFNQISDAEYDVFCDDVKLDEQLIRYCGTYMYNVPKETNGNTTYTTNSFQNVVRVDALGLKKGSTRLKSLRKPRQTTPR